MKWFNLLNKNNPKCPKCGSSLIYKKDTQNFECALYDEETTSIFSCDFSISPQKLNYLQDKIKTKKYISEFDHLNDYKLNNL